MTVRSFLTRLSLFVAGIAVVTSASAQVNTYDRLSVIEEFTSATCPPCVAASETLADVVRLSNGVVSVRFHMNWPAPNDPWNLDNPTDNDTRRGYYSVTGIPDAALNGVKTSPTNGPALLAAIASDNAEKSPIKIELSETPNASGGDITVKVSTNINLTSHKLYVAVVSYYTEMPNLPNTLANSNGETEFRDAMNKMVPNAGGTTMNINANANQTFNLSYVRKNATTWPDGQQYIVAYVQNTATKEVLNAATTLDIIYATPSVSGNPYEYIERGGSKTREVTITNPRTEELIANVAIKNEADLTAAGWVTSLNKTEVTIPANSSTTVTVTSNAINRGFFAPIELEVVPFTTEGISQSTSIFFGYLTENTQIAVYYGASNTAVGNYIPALQTTFATEVAYLPFIEDVLNAFPPSSFEAGIFPCGYDGRFNMIYFIPAIEAMTAAGKGVWMSAPIGLAVAFNANNQQYPGYPEAKAWFEQTLGVGLKNTANRNDGQYYTSFGIKGVAGDPIGANFSATCNQPTQQWPFATAYQDLMTIGGGSKSKSWCFADNLSANVSAVRWEDTGKGKIVFSTFGPELLSTEASRKDVTQRILDWLLEPANVDEPEITLSASTLNYGGITVGEHSDKSFIIQNSGKANLTINSIELNGSDAVDFDIIAGQPATGPINVAPNGSHTVTVRFAPSAVKSTYAASVIIDANAPASDVSLRGSGLASSVETEVASETGAIGMALVGQNPLSDASSVKVSATGSITVTVVDASGRVVNTIFSGNVAGTEVVSLNSSALTSGTYMIVATNGTERAVLSVVVAR